VISRARLHRLVDELPEGEISTAERFLEYVRNVGCDSVLQGFMQAPMDDEPLTAEEDGAIREAEAELARGEGIPWEEVRKNLRLSRKGNR
jgi:hypothetical protein